MTGIVQEMKRVVADVLGDEPKANDVVYALIQNFGGERLYLPHSDYDRRNQEIMDLYNAGAEIEKLAARYRLSEKTIKRILQTV